MPAWERDMLDAPWPEGRTQVWPMWPRGGLWVGGAWEREPADGFDVVVTLTRRDEADVVVRRPARHVRYPMADDEDGLDRDGLAELVAYVVRWVREGKRVLVQCYLGLNRSGLVAALALRELSGCTGPEAVALLRVLRDTNVLCNPAFHAIAVAP